MLFYRSNAKSDQTNLQIVDPSLKILNINARYPGARNDAYIWSSLPIRRAMEFQYNRGERRTWLIGKVLICTFCYTYINMVNNIDTFRLPISI